jgi:hypothetical protein
VPAEPSWNASNPVVEVGLQRESCLDHNSGEDYAVHDESDPRFAASFVSPDRSKDRELYTIPASAVPAIDNQLYLTAIFEH